MQLSQILDGSKSDHVLQKGLEDYVSNLLGSFEREEGVTPSVFYLGEKSNEEVRT